MRDNEVEVIIKGQGQRQYESYPYSFVWIIFGSFFEIETEVRRW